MFVIALVVPAILPAVLSDLLTPYLVTLVFLFLRGLKLQLHTPLFYLCLFPFIFDGSSKQSQPELRHYQQIGSFGLHQLPFFCSNLSLDVGCQVVIASGPETEIINIHITVYRYILIVVAVDWARDNHGLDGQSSM